ncbi:amino acid adenylation domain-containing protein [Alteromonas sp. a30]|uniref:amino acid adenylation domain-containing protein n=1 Tax=Alteromonas sp. a30 TaxID=2730917 RepID=UPI00227EE24C|nr:AMP-binding protein [Alteromonas sp. a30]MCY7294915.1 AMP-binding protein [Alteromonas sp. a30]
MPTNILQGFYAAVEKNPLNNAVIDTQGHSLTYQEVAEFIGHLSTFIQSENYFRVGVLMPRSIDSIIAFLSIIEANSTYIPFNIQQEEQQRLSLIEQAELDIILCNNETESLIPENQKKLNINLNTKKSYKTPNQQRKTNAIYEIFTSGSTGKPKLVQITSSNLIAHQNAFSKKIRLSPDDKILQSCALSFDVSIEEVLSTLNAGATLIVGLDPAKTDMPTLNQILQKYGITTVNFPTALWNNWTDFLADTGARPPASLHTVIIGSEMCSTSKLQRWFTLNLPISLYNAYGLTETTITNSIWLAHPLSDNDIVPIGQPLTDNNLYILDGNNQPVAEGEEGELVITGKQIGKGYRNLPPDQVSRFEWITFANDQKQYAYRTGDRAKRLSNGDYVILGRIDRQLKIHGFRVEATAIESAIEKQPNIEQCFVQLLEQQTPAKLVAYIVGPLSQQVPTGELLAWQAHEQLTHYLPALQQLLPAYALPHFFCVLEAFPMTTNGKIDAKTLSQLHQINVQHPHQTDTTSVKHNHPLIGITETLLQHGLISGLSFVAQGGDSISAQQLVNRAYAAGFSLNMESLLSEQDLLPILLDASPIDNPTSQRDSDAQPSFAIIADKTLPKTILKRIYQHKGVLNKMSYIRKASQTQHEMLYASRLIPGEGDIVEQTEGQLPNLNPALFMQAWQYAIEKFDALRSCFLTEDDETHYWVSYNDYQISWITHQQQDIPSLLVEDREQGFSDLSLPPYRLYLVEQGSGDYHFIWSYHHALLDGWSELIILDYVFECYQQLQQSQSVPPPASRHFVHYLDYVESYQFIDQDYWRDYLHYIEPCFIGDPQASLQEHPSGETLEIGAVPLHSYHLMKTKMPWLTVGIWAQALAAKTLSKIKQRNRCTYGILASSRPKHIPFIDETAGLFLHLLPVQVTLRDDDDTSLLQQIKQVNGEHASHAHEFEKTPTSRKYSAQRFDVGVVMDNYPNATNAFTRALTNHSQSALSLTFYFSQKGDELMLTLQYKPRYLSNAEIERVQTALHEVLSHWQDYWN